MTGDASHPVSIWPRLVLWLLVIAFGIFYLDAIRERGIEERAARLAEHSAPTATATGTIAQASPSAEAATTETAPRLADEANEDVSPQEAPSNEPPRAELSDQRTERGRSASDSIKERQARLLAEYEALRRSAEAERRRAWRQGIVNGYLPPPARPHYWTVQPTYSPPSLR